MIKNGIKKVKNEIIDVKFLLEYFKKYSEGKKYVTYSIIMNILDIIPSITFMIIPGMIINELVGKTRTKYLMFYVGVLAIVHFFGYIKERTLRVKISALYRELKRLFQADLQQYISQMDYASLECPDVAVELNRISMNAPGAPLDMFAYVSNLFGAILNLITLTLVMTYLSPLVVILLITIVLVNSFATKKINLLNYEYGRLISEKENAYWVEFYNLTNYANGKEMRLFGTKDFFIERYSLIGRKIDMISHCQDVAQKNWMLVHTLTGILQHIVLYAVGIYQVLKGGVAIGTMTIFMSAANQFSGVLGKITGVILEISNYCQHVDEIRNFMNHPAANGGSIELKTLSDNFVISFNNVSFRYPGSERYALHNVDFEVKCNDTLCIIGENGSGKSTFIKLLMGLYKPTEGEILIDGKNINDYTLCSYQKNFSPVFQDFSSYAMPLKLNVALCNVPNDENVKNVISSVGLTDLVKNLPKGLDTYMGKNIESDGFEPSGGEAQKIAIARALYHGGEIYILDEPTAALDPNAEYEIYTQFHNMIKDKTAILVTHRLSAVQLADKVAVFDDGQIIEYGTHSELYAKGGKYKEMFDKQSEFYVKAANDCNTDTV